MTNGQVSEGSADLNYILILDAMGERYGILPSEILERATTTDLFVFDTAAGYRAEKEREARGLKNPNELTTDDLLKKMEKFKGDKTKTDKK